MWLTLLGATLVGVVTLYAPGYLLSRTFPCSRFASVAIAPMLSACLYTLLGIALQAAGLVLPAYSLLAIALALSLIVLLCAELAGNASGKKGAADSSSQLFGYHTDDHEVWSTAALYIAVSLGLATIIFILGIGSPDAFSRHDDTTMHTSIVRGFLDTGTYSTLHAGAYLDQGLADSHYYPSQWHIPVAIVASIFGNDVAIACNAVILVFLVLVFPFAICLLMRELFPENGSARRAGSLFTLAFSGFPWGFLVFGQLLPNMMSFMFTPLALAILIELTRVNSAYDKAKLACALLIGVVSITLAQPNGIFTFGIWAFLYLLSRLFYEPESETATVTKARVIGAAALILTGCLLWAAAYNAPFMQTVVQNTWKAQASVIEALGAGLLFMFMVREGVHPFLSILVLIGVLYTFRHRRHLWLTAAYAIALAFYVIDMSTDGPLKHVLTGFWYTDYYRTGAMTSLFAMPLAGLGFSCAFKALRGALERIGKGSVKPKAAWVSAALLTVALAACQFAPLHVQFGEAEITCGLPHIKNQLSFFYSWERVLTSEENAFVKQTLDTIPDGSLIVNVPRDGSCWAYGVDGANMFFRRSSNSGMADDETSELLRIHLAEISTNEQVRSAVDDWNARYVIQLDCESSDNPTTVHIRYKPENWVGIESIVEDTPGFELISSEGDMRLFRIKSADET